MAAPAQNNMATFDERVDARITALGLPRRMDLDWQMMFHRALGDAMYEVNVTQRVRWLQFRLWRKGFDRFLEMREQIRVIEQIVRQEIDEEAAMANGNL